MLCFWHYVFVLQYFCRCDGLKNTIFRKLTNPVEENHQVNQVLCDPNDYQFQKRPGCVPTHAPTHSPTHVTELKNPTASTSNKYDFDITKSEVTKLQATDSSQYDHYGFSVALRKHVAVVGAYANQNAGAAYIYSLYKPLGLSNKAEWTLNDRIVSNDLKFNDNFGYSITMNNQTIFISAYRSNLGDVGGVGAVYVFEEDENTGRYTQKHRLLSFTPTSSEFFGFAMATDGLFTFISAYGNSDKGINAGIVYIFKKDLGSRFFGHNGRLYPSDATTGTLFGCSVSIHKYVSVIGAMGDSSYGLASGAAYVFRYDISTNSWDEEAKLIGNDVDSYDYFGFAVAIQGNMVLISAYAGDGTVTGSGVVYVFRRTVSSSADNSNNNGQSARMDLVGTVNGWEQIEKIYPSDGHHNSYFGYSLSFQGSNVIIGAPGDNSLASSIGTIYAYALTEEGYWDYKSFSTSPSKGDNDGFGCSVALYNNIVLVGSEYGDGRVLDTGVSYVYTPHNEYSEALSSQLHKYIKKSISQSITKFMNHYLKYILITIAFLVSIILLSFGMKTMVDSYPKIFHFPPHILSTNSSMSMQPLPADSLSGKQENELGSRSGLLDLSQSALSWSESEQHSTDRFGSHTVGYVTPNVIQSNVTTSNDIVFKKSKYQNEKHKKANIVPNHE